MEKITIASPDIGEEEKRAVMAVLESGVIAQGERVALFESMFAEYCEVEHAVMVNSGTAAIHAALHAANVGPGDEVITTPFSFIATVNPILMQGAEVRFADIKQEDFNIDVSKVEAQITPKTKAIIAVDLYGQPYDYSEMRGLADQYGIELIEDACQAVGAMYRDKKAGALGEIACFSLYATKNMIAGEGGVLTTDNSRVAQSARSFRQHGMSSAYQYEELGYNYRSTDIAAAIAIEQLRKVDMFNEKRRENARKYNVGLANIPGLITPEVSPGRDHVYHQYTIRVTEEFCVTRDELKALLNNEGVGAGVYYPKPLHLYPHISSLGFSEGDFPVAEEASRQVLSLPVHPKLDMDHIERVIESIRRIAHV